MDLGTALAFGEIRHCEKGLVDYSLGLAVEQCLACAAVDLTARSKFLKTARTVLGGVGKASDFLASMERKTADRSA